MFHSTFQRITPPTDYLTFIPVVEAEAHCRLTPGEDQDYVQSLIPAAVDSIEEQVNQAILKGTYVVTFANFYGKLALPRTGFVLKTDVDLKYYDSSDSIATLDPARYIITLGSQLQPTWVTTAAGASWPTVSSNVTRNDRVQIEYISGYDTANVPVVLKHACLLRIAEMYYMNRETSEKAVNHTKLIDYLLAGYVNRLL